MNFSGEGPFFRKGEGPGLDNNGAGRGTTTIWRMKSLDSGVALSMGECWIVSLGCCDVTEAGHADELEAERERSQLMSILAAD